MQETLFDKVGNAIAYIDYDDENTIYLWNGKPTAYLDNENCIYGFNGQHLGWYEKGVLWNLSGERNGFNNSALSVFAKFEPFKSFKNFKPFKSFKQFTKTKPYYKTTTSNESLSQFLMRGAK